MRRLLLLSVVFAAALAISGVGTASAGGNKTGQFCQKNGWQSLIIVATGGRFGSEPACTSYIARNGTSGIAATIDVAIATAPTTCLPEFADGFACDAKAIAVTNPGTADVTVTGTVLIPFGGCLGTNIASAQCRLLFIAGSWTPAPEGAFDFTVTVPAGKTLTMAIPLVEIVAVRVPGVPASMSLSGIATIASVSTVLGLQVIDANSANNSSSWAVAAVYPGTT